MTLYGTCYTNSKMHLEDKIIKEEQEGLTLIRSLKAHHKVLEIRTLWYLWNYRKIDYRTNGVSRNNLI